MKVPYICSLSILFLMLFQIARANVIVYDTYESFNTKNGIEYKGYEFDGATAPSGNFTVKFKKKGEKKVKVDSEIWGFTYKGVLFRQAPNGYPLKVISTDKICYYENGPLYLRMLKNNSSDGHILITSSSIDILFSKSLDSEMKPICLLANEQKEEKGNDYHEANSEFETLCDCMKSKGSDLSIVNARKCMPLYLEGTEE